MLLTLSYIILSLKESIIYVFDFTNRTKNENSR